MLWGAGEGCSLKEAAGPSLPAGRTWEELRMTLHLGQNKKNWVPGLLPNQRLQFLSAFLECDQSCCRLLPVAICPWRKWQPYTFFSVNKSNHSQGYGETEKLVSFLDFWTPSSENLFIVLPVDPVKDILFIKWKAVSFNCLPDSFQIKSMFYSSIKGMLGDISDLDLLVSETDDFIQLVCGRM